MLPRPMVCVTRHFADDFVIPWCPLMFRPMCAGIE